VNAAFPEVCNAPVACASRAAFIGRGSQEALAIIEKNKPVVFARL
jgi:hypothetical protein